MNYEKLLENILNTPSLTKAVDDIVHKTGALNLVTLDWKNVLEQSNVFQKHSAKQVNYSKMKESNNVSVKTIYNMNHQFNIIVPGFWIFDVYGSIKSGGTMTGSNTSTSTPMKKKHVSDSIVCLKSEPLEYIGWIMAKNEDQKLSDNCRFYIKSCEPAGCHVCGKFQKKQFGNKWCIKFTKIHDGKDLKHTLRSTVIKTFGQGKCMGILHLTIRQYLMYGENHFKIGGDCNDMILFHDIFQDVSHLKLDYLLDEKMEEEEQLLEGIPQNNQ